MSVEEELDDAMPERELGRGCAVVHAELGKGVRDMRTDGIGTEVEPLGKEMPTKTRATLKALCYRRMAKV